MYFWQKNRIIINVQELSKTYIDSDMESIAKYVGLTADKGNFSKNKNMLSVLKDIVWECMKRWSKLIRRYLIKMERWTITDEIREYLPYTCAYAELYGKKVSENVYEVDLISTFETPPRYEHQPELLYEECIRLGKKWTDLVSRVKKGMIL